MRKNVLALLLSLSLFLTAYSMEAQLEHEEAGSRAHETGYASEHYRALNLSKTPAIEALEKQTGKRIDTSVKPTKSPGLEAFERQNGIEIDTTWPTKSPGIKAFERQNGIEIDISAPAKTASEKYYEEHPERRYSNPYSTAAPQTGAEYVDEETNRTNNEQETSETGWRGLSFVEYIISFLLTLIVYGLFPFSFSRLREKPITTRKYRIWCYAVNLLGVAFFVLLNGRSNSAAYVIWTSVFAYNGVQHLTKRGLIIQPVQAKD